MTLPELTAEDMNSRRAAVDESWKGGDETYWIYDHLPLAMWMGNMTKEDQARYEIVFEEIEPYLKLIHIWLQNIYPSDMQLQELCAAPLYWNPTPMLEAAYFLTRWLLPFDTLNWRTLRSVLHVCGPLQLKPQFRGTDDQTFPIRMDLEGGAYQDQYYDPIEHGDPLNYPDAFRGLMDEEPLWICHNISKEEWAKWRDNPLFQENWG